MRRHFSFLAALAAVSALFVAAPATAVTASPHTGTHVLTVGKRGGRAVAPKAVLTAGLAKGSSAVFTVAGLTLKCGRAKFSKTVRTNPRAPGAATLSNNKQSFAKCVVSITGASVTSVTAKNLPYNVRASDAKGDPVKVSERKKRAPLTFTATIKFGMQSVTCSYSAASINGHFSNKTNVVTFVNQQFAKSAGGRACPPGPALFSARFGPIIDTSVKGHPKIFVN